MKDEKGACPHCGAPRGADHGILCPTERSDDPDERVCLQCRKPGCAETFNRCPETATNEEDGYEMCAGIAEALGPNPNVDAIARALLAVHKGARRPMARPELTCTPTSEWGCEARKKLGVARGAIAEAIGELKGMADETEGEMRDTFAYVIENLEVAENETAQPQPCKPTVTTACDTCGWIHEGEEHPPREQWRSWEQRAREAERVIAELAQRRAGASQEAVERAAEIVRRLGNVDGIRTEQIERIDGGWVVVVSYLRRENALPCVACSMKEGEIAQLRVRLGNEKDCVAQRDRVIRDFVTVQTAMLEPGTLVPHDWKEAFDALRMLSKYGAPAPTIEGRSLWRTGTKLGRTLYKGNKVVGLLDTPELASLAARAINAYATWADDEELMCTTDSYQQMQEALRQIADLEEANGRHDSPIYQLAVEALPHRPEPPIAIAELQEPIVENEEEQPPETQDEPVHYLAPPIWRTYVTKCGSEWAAVFQVGPQYFTISQSNERDTVVFMKEMIEKAIDKIHDKSFKDGFKDGFEKGRDEGHNEGRVEGGHCGH